MTSATINSTGRKSIDMNRIEISVVELENEPRKAILNALNVTDMGFPGNATVFIEAYYRSSVRRAPCGTIGNLNLPVEMELNRDQFPNPRFKLKVVDMGQHLGRLLGAALFPLEHKGRSSILPVIARDLGEEVWRVEIHEDAQPELLINEDLRGFSTRLRTDDRMQALVLPAAFRYVLEELWMGKRDDAFEWKKNWMKFCTRALKVSENPGTDEEERKAWIDEAVNRFSRKHGMMKKLQKELDG